ncbi:myocilin-like [Poecilia reticulata]|uniref:Myocilin n=1 Tax=Poecilia reticulata TaxID=8081 RepID=A0A3P9N851_POERE|nr:PREDICTED: myocilin-like [Poecilia reticulata]
MLNVLLGFRHQPALTGTDRQKTEKTETDKAAIKTSKMLLLLFFLSLSCFAVFSQSQGQAYLSRSNDPNGRCVYSFTVASPQESSCPRGNAKSEMDEVLTRLTLLEALVSQLTARGERGTASGGLKHSEENLQEAYAQVTRERNQLQLDQERLNAQVRKLQGTVAELNRETERLRQRPCEQTHTSGGTLYENRPLRDPGFHFENTSYQEMKAKVKEVPASRLLPEGIQRASSPKLSPNISSGCGKVLSVGDPVLHRKADAITGKYGVWLQDPDPRGPYYTNKTVWRIDSVGREIRQLFVYEDMDQFSKGFPMKVLVLPEPVESTGATVYRGSLYYQRRRSRTLLRYNLTSESLASRLDLPHAGFHGQHPYSWGGYTDIDLAADEQGLWVIYSTGKAKGAIVISQLDPASLEVRRSWETKIRKNSVGNAFMVCGHLYTVASYTTPNTTINYMFDTATSEGQAVAVPFVNKYRYNSMVDYNHAQRKLYAWDNFHMVTYDVRLG